MNSQKKISQEELISEIEKLKARIKELESGEQSGEEEDFSFAEMFGELFGAGGFDLSSIQEQLLSSSLHNIPNPAYMLDIERKISGINYHFSNLFNCSLENTLGKKLVNIFPAKISEELLIKEKSIETGGITDFEIEFDFEGKSKIMVVAESNFQDLAGNPSGYVGVLNDITDKRLAERELINSERKLRDANATKDKFLSIISHDLKSPFSALLGYTDMLMDDFDSYSREEIKDFLNQIQNSASNAYKLLDNLLQWSRAVRNLVPFNPSPLNIKQLADEAIKTFENEIAQKNIHVTNLLQKDQVLFADNFMISAIIKNLLSNSIKFSNNGGIIVIDSINGENSLDISILDNGIGIKESDIELLFNLDVHYKKIGNSKESGSGLGLILCKEFVAKHDGNIWVESTFGQGTKVTFSIPIKKY